MNRIQMFYNDDLVALQLTINEWLTEHKEIEIVDANISSLGKPSQRAGVTSSERHIFYILYRLADTGIKAAQELTAHEPQESALEFGPVVQSPMEPGPGVSLPLNKAGTRYPASQKLKDEFL